MLIDSRYDIKTLLLQVSKGNQLAFKAVFDFYKERFYSASFKMTKSGDVAEEIVQEVFISLWIKRDQVASAANPEAYLFTMLNNSIYAHFRKMALEKTMKKKVLGESSRIDESPIEDMFFAKENYQMLEEVISQLPRQQRTVYKLCRQQGLTREQIATQLHISPHTVKNHLREAIKFIRTYYKLDASAFIWIVIWLCF